MCAWVCVCVGVGVCACVGGWVLERERERLFRGISDHAVRKKDRTDQKAVLPIFLFFFTFDLFFGKPVFFRFPANVG